MLSARGDTAIIVHLARHRGRLDVQTAGRLDVTLAGRDETERVEREGLTPAVPELTEGDHALVECVRAAS